MEESHSWKLAVTAVVCVIGQSYHLNSYHIMSYHATSCYVIIGHVI